jgi:hypothetical protein
MHLGSRLAPGPTTITFYTWRRMAISGDLSLTPMLVPTPAFVPVRVEDDKPARPAMVNDDAAAVMMVIELLGKCLPVR